MRVKEENLLWASCSSG